MQKSADNELAYHRDGVEYLDRIIQLFGGYKRRGIDFLQPQPGMRVLDAGCGTGDDARLLAGLAGPQGRVVGMDYSSEMIAVARQRAVGANPAVEFVEGDVYRLDFPDGSFTRTRAERLFQHLKDPERALRELIRVTEPGGLIVLLDVDWGTLVIDAGDRDITGRILSHHCASQVNGAAGRSLYGWAQRARLGEIAIIAETIAITELPVAAYVWGLDGFAKKAAAAGVITPRQATSWLSDLRERDRDGAFFAAISGFGVRGRKPT